MIDKKTVEYVAKLARVGITDEEKEWISFSRLIEEAKPHFIHLKNLNILKALK